MGCLLMDKGEFVLTDGRPILKQIVSGICLGAYWVMFGFAGCVAISTFSGFEFFDVCFVVLVVSAIMGAWAIFCLLFIAAYEWATQ